MLKKKITAFVLATALVVSLFPATVFAQAPEETQGEETAAEVSATTDASAPAADEASVNADEEKTEEKEVSAEADALADKKLEEGELEEEGTAVLNASDFMVSNPLNFDAFAKASTKKTNTEEGVQTHHFWNLFMFEDDPMSRGTVEYHYNGGVYSFPDCETLYQAVRQANAAGETCTVQLMLKPDQAGLAYDGVSTDTGTGQTAKYFQPDAQTAAKRNKLEAYMDYMSKKFGSNEAHVDAWVVGNEVNMPVQWNWSGTTNPDEIVNRYSAFYNLVYDQVREVNNYSRVCVCLDHSFSNNDQGRGVAGKDFLTKFNASCGGRDWSIAYHPYPALLENPVIWNDQAILAGYGLTNDVNSQNADFVDGSNYNQLSTFVTNTFGPSHRIIVTEFGINSNQGEDVQAAALAMTYYATSTDPMTDAVIYQGHDQYSLTNKAKEVWNIVDSTNPADQEQVAQMVLPTINATSPNKTSTNSYSAWHELIPTMPSTVANRTEVGKFVTRLYEICLGRTPAQSEVDYWVDQMLTGKRTSAEVGAAFLVDADEMKNKNLSDKEFVTCCYRAMMGREPDEAGLNDWVNKMGQCVGRNGVYLGFANSKEFATLCAGYGVTPGTYTPSEWNDKNPNLTQFIYRQYTKCLGRTAEIAGVKYWCEQVLTGQRTVDQVSTEGFFHSPEFLGKNMSDEDFVETCYATFFDRASDAAGKADWLNRMKSQGLSRDGVLDGFCNSPEFNNLKNSMGVAHITPIQ